MVGGNISETFTFRILYHFSHRRCKSVGTRELGDEAEDGARVTAVIYFLLFVM